jgi:hypothetical protein
MLNNGERQWTVKWVKEMLEVQPASGALLAAFRLPDRSDRQDAHAHTTLPTYAHWVTPSKAASPKFFIKLLSVHLHTLCILYTDLSSSSKLLSLKVTCSSCSYSSHRFNKYRQNEILQVMQNLNEGK